MIMYLHYMYLYHKEIHKRNIRTGDELKKQEEDIKRTVMDKK